MVHQNPNIILITPHDLGTYLGCYGWDPQLSTPSLDKLADEGVRFTNNFSTAPFCSPSRGSIFTGKYPHTNGLMGLVNLGWHLPSSNRILGQLLQSTGYETFLFGNQHIAEDSCIAEDPSQLGFDYISERGKCSCEVVAPIVTDFLKKRAKEGSKPFYAEVGFSQVHRPYRDIEMLSVQEKNISVLPYLEDTPGLRQDMAMFYAVIQYMDRAVGTILATLDNTRLKENTIVIFTTDHGIAFPRAKATLYDPGINTTLLMRWPDGFNGGRVISELISNIDLLPTLLDVVGIPIPEDVQGRSFLGLLQDEEYTPNSMIFAEKNSHKDDIKRCIRTKRYKYIRNFNGGPLISLPLDIEVTLARRNMGDRHLAPRPPVELYDLEKDPYEKNNLASSPDYADIEKELSSKLQKVLEDTNDPILSGRIQRPADEEEIMTSCIKEIHQRLSYEKKIHRRYEKLKEQIEKGKLK
ncbi:MAG: sulfatase [bacterium]